MKIGCVPTLKLKGWQGNEKRMFTIHFDRIKLYNNFYKCVTFKLRRLSLAFEGASILIFQSEKKYKPKFQIHPFIGK